jgi:hypothetical protein
MPAMFRVTYDIVTPESAECGDIEECGFVTPGGWKTPIESSMKEPDSDFDMTLREAMRLCSPSENSGRWWSESDSRICYQTGEHESRSIHPPRNITESSYRRVSRLLGLA